MSFHSGDLLKCVDASWSGGELKNGATYEVTSVTDTGAVRVSGSSCGWTPGRFVLDTDAMKQRQENLRKLAAQNEVSMPAVGTAQAALHSLNPVDFASPVGAKPEPNSVNQTPAPNATVAASILDEASTIVKGARNTTHGDKERSFGAIAALWNAYLLNRKAAQENPFPESISAFDVAQMMVLLKMGRSIQGKPVRDHFVDAAGYSAIAGELVA